MQLIKVSWKTESVLALKKKTESELELSVFYLVPKHFWSPKAKTLSSIAHDSAYIVQIIMKLFLYTWPSTLPKCSNAESKFSLKILFTQLRIHWKTASISLGKSKRS